MSTFPTEIAGQFGVNFGENLQGIIFKRSKQFRKQFSILVLKSIQIISVRLLLSSQRYDEGINFVIRHYRSRLHFGQFQHGQLYAQE